MNELVRDWKAEKKDLEEAFDIIADKLVKADAEIGRLKEAMEAVDDHGRALSFIETLKAKEAKLLEHEALIRELCEALAESGYYAGTGSLIARAREATR